MMFSSMATSTVSLMATVVGRVLDETSSMEISSDMLVAKLVEILFGSSVVEDVVDSVVVDAVVVVIVNFGVDEMAVDVSDFSVVSSNSDTGFKDDVVSRNKVVDSVVNVVDVVGVVDVVSVVDSVKIFGTVVDSSVKMFIEVVNVVVGAVVDVLAVVVTTVLDGNGAEVDEAASVSAASTSLFCLALSRASKTHTLALDSHWPSSLVLQS